MPDSLGQAVSHPINSDFESALRTLPEPGVSYGASIADYGWAELALAAYNAGENRVDRWMKEFGGRDMALFLELIPFSEARAHVKQVLTNQAHCRLRTPSASGKLQ
ncbi:MAG: hypothetical protein ABIG68_08480 [Acidobacteriota bacterium]